MKILIHSLVWAGYLGFVFTLVWAFSQAKPRVREFIEIAPKQWSAGIALPTEPKRYGPENSLFPRPKLY